jgi:hypothetical protein
MCYSKVHANKLGILFAIPQNMPLQNKSNSVNTGMSYAIEKNMPP